MGPRAEKRSVHFGLDRLWVWGISEAVGAAARRYVPSPKTPLKTRIRILLIRLMQKQLLQNSVPFARPWKVRPQAGTMLNYHNCSCFGWDRFPLPCFDPGKTAPLHRARGAGIALQPPPAGSRVYMAFMVTEGEGPSDFASRKIAVLPRTHTHTLPVYIAHMEHVNQAIIPICGN